MKRRPPHRLFPSCRRETPGGHPQRRLLPRHPPAEAPLAPQQPAPQLRPLQRLAGRRPQPLPPAATPARQGPGLLCAAGGVGGGPGSAGPGHLRRPPPTPERLEVPPDLAAVAAPPTAGREGGGGAKKSSPEGKQGSLSAHLTRAPGPCSLGPCRPPAAGKEGASREALHQQNRSGSCGGCHTLQKWALPHSAQGSQQGRTQLL